MSEVSTDKSACMDWLGELPTIAFDEALYTKDRYLRSTKIMDGVLEIVYRRNAVAGGTSDAERVFRRTGSLRQRMSTLTQIAAEQFRAPDPNAAMKRERFDAAMKSALAAVEHMDGDEVTHE